MNTLFYFAIFISSLAITWIVRKFAIRKSIMDISNDKSSHIVPTPRGGGVQRRNFFR